MYSKDILAPVFDASPYPSIALAGKSLLFLFRIDLHQFVPPTSHILNYVLN